jgi:hypothetical protein
MYFYKEYGVLGIKKRNKTKKEQKKNKTWISPNIEICKAGTLMSFVTCFLQL